MRKVSFCEIYSFRTLFSWARPITTFSLEFISSSKNVKKDAIRLKLFWYKVFVRWKLKLLNLLMDPF